MSPSDRIAISAHLHVLLRRKLGRITDTEWMATNEEYASAIVSLCREQPDQELRTMADKLDAMYVAERRRKAPPAPAPAPLPTPVVNSRTEIEQRYIGRLR